MTAYAGGPQIQNYLDPERPDYGAMVLSSAENASALERALMQLNADVRGTELTEEARVKAAKLGYQGASNLANAGTFAAGMGAFGKVAGAGLSAYGNEFGFGGIGTDTMGASDMDNFNLSPADQRTLSRGGIIDRGTIG